MSYHRSRRPTSSDSGYSSTTSTPSRDRVKEFIGREQTKSQDQQLENASSLSHAKRVDLSSSIGSELSGIQLSNLNAQQLDDLALLVSERGVVILKEQDLTKGDQIRVSGHYGKLGKHIIEKETGRVKVKTSENDFGEVLVPVSRAQKAWVSDRSYETNPASYSIFKAENSGSDTIWISQYGLYDALSKPVKRFLDELRAVHTSTLQYESIRDLRGMPKERSPVEAFHPAVRTHPVTGLKALNVTPGTVATFEDLSSKESDKLLELLEHNIYSSDEHTVRLKWEAGSVAIWDNRCTAYKHIAFGTNTLSGYETSSVGEKPYFDAQSESREERVQRLAKEKEEERIRIQEIKARFNNTPLRRILRNQALGSPVQSFYVDSRESKRPEKPIAQHHVAFRLRSNSEIREQEEKIWAQTSTSTSTEKQEHPKPLFRLRSNSEIRELEKEVWAQSATSLGKQGDQGVSVDKPRRKVSRVNSNGSPLRRIIQRQASGTPRIKS